MKSLAIKFVVIIALALGLTEFFFFFNAKFIHLNLVNRTENSFSEPGGVVLSEETVSKIRSLYNSVQIRDPELDEKVKNLGAPGENFNIITKPRNIADYMSYRGNNEPAIEKFTSRLEYPALGAIIYDVVYGLTPRRIRKTEFVENSADKRPILMLGCSFTFGQGVQDNETVSYYLQMLRPQDEVFNLGVSTSGLNDVIDDFLKSNRTKNLVKHPGLAVYTYYGFHNERTFCLGSCYDWPKSNFMPKKTDYDVTSEGLSDRGSFEESRGLWNSALKILDKTYTWPFIFRYAANPNSPEYQEKFAKLLKELEKLLKKQHVDLLIYLPRGDLLTLNQAVVSAFQKENLTLLYSAPNEWIDKMNGRGKIPGDGHNNSAGNEAQAIYIDELLKAKGL